DRSRSTPAAASSPAPTRRPSCRSPTPSWSRCGTPSAPADPMTTIAVAVVLAGGASRRFGADKLAAAVDGTTLLDRALSGLAADRTVIVVGPARPVDRTVGFIPDDHPSGGPAAALVTGLRAAVDLAADLIMVLPGDAPAGGAAAELLATRLAEDPAGPGVVGVTADGREQPLQLALRRPAAERVLAAAGS